MRSTRRRDPLLLLLVLALGACATAPAKPSSSSSSSFTWTLHLLPGGDVDTGAVDTRLCFSGAPPEHVGPENLKALPWLMDLPRPVDADGRELGPPLPVDAQGIVTRGLREGGCVAFSVDVEAAARDLDDRDVAAVVGRSILASPDAWLWRPKPWPVGVVGKLVVEDFGLPGHSGALSPGHSGALHGDAEAGSRGSGPLRARRLAVPFARDDDGSYRVPASTFALQCFAALGDIAVRDVSARGVTLHVARVDGGGVDDERLEDWLRVAIDDVAVPLERFPVGEVLVLLVPVAGRRAIAAGFLGRGGGPSALFMLGRGPLGALDEDAALPSPGEPLEDDGRWVFTHELAHALLPPVARGDGWLNEGLTTWHQEVLPAAAGRRARALAQDQLEIGFRTGRARAGQDGLSVERSCTEMDRRGTYQHCYWAGARLIDLLAREVGDDGVFQLVRALHAARSIDAEPLPALRLLETASTSTTPPAAAAAAAALLRLWEAHRNAPFPDPAADPGPDPTTTAAAESALASR
ncbi:MAG: hypothetical protein Q8O67_19145 [Deltaproteobacteria bacterium]|nr:hypothetical protein [Deltaproteobacteria bacterium]